MRGDKPMKKHKCYYPAECPCNEPKHRHCQNPDADCSYRRLTDAMRYLPICLLLPNLFHTGKHNTRKDKNV